MPVFLNARSTTVRSRKRQPSVAWSDVTILILTIVAAVEVLLHSRVDLPTATGGVLYWGPAVVFVALGSLAFMSRWRTGVHWALVLWGWIMIIITLVTLLPSTAGREYRADPALHYAMHALIFVTQIVLIVFVIRRLGTDAERASTARHKLAGR